MNDRFSPEHVEAWRRDGGVVIENFFTREEVAAVRADFETVWERVQGGPDPTVYKRPGELGRFNPHQFVLNDTIPFECSPALNLIGVHPAMMAFAREALGTDDVLMYQCEAWAKFTGDADYDQPFHCDFANHTLTAPSLDERLNSVTTLCYFSDVPEACGPAHYVTRPDSAEIAGPEMTLVHDPEAMAPIQMALSARARSTASPAGSIFPYAFDVWHRGTNLTEPGGHRYAVMASYHRADDRSVNRYAWPLYFTKPWRIVFENATPEQLTAFGVQPPGDPFWTAETLRRAQLRYPGWDMSAYRDAARAAA